MRSSSADLERAAELRAKGKLAARAGQLRVARVAFLQSLKHDPDRASTFLWLAGVAATEREAYRFLDRARQLDPDHPQLARAAVGIHQHFAQARQKAVPEAAPKVALKATPQKPVARPRLRLPKGALGGVARVVLPFAWRLLSIAVLLVAVVFFVALLLELGRAGGVGALPQAAPTAAEYTANYFQGVLRGDLGEIASRFGSNRGTPVIEELKRALPKSLGLLVASLLIAVVVGLCLGMAAALRRHSRLSGVILSISTLGVSTPSFFAAMLLIWFGVWLYRTTGQQVFPLAGFGWDSHLLLPALVLATRPAAAVTRLSYNALTEILNADHVRTARSKGLRQWAILREHVLRNAGVPILTTVVVSLRFSLAILPIVEYIFSWPGIGQMLLKAIQAQDTTAVVGMVLPLALLFALVNMVADMLCLRLDPRLRDAKVGAV